MPDPTILAFLQNQWFKDPERMRRIFKKHPDQRNDLIARCLFMGYPHCCLTGRRLWEAFGETLCNRIVWEEASREMSDHPSACPPADPKHMMETILRLRPAIVLAFGRIAQEGLWGAMRAMDDAPFRIAFHAICGPHPAARAGAVEGLKNAAEMLRKQLEVCHA